MRWLRLLFAAVLLAVGGCAGTGTGTSPSAEPSTSFAPDDLVLQVRVAGGFLPVAMAATEIPMLSVYGDGRVITSGPVPDIYPSPALPNMQVQHIAAADMAKLTRKALDAGVGSAVDLGMPQVADAPTTHIMVRTASGEKTTDAPALGIGGDNGLTATQLSARRKLQDLVAALTDLTKTLGAQAIDEPQPYTPTAVAAVATEWLPTNEPMLKDPPPMAWPGPQLPGEPMRYSTAVSCVNATGTQANQVLTAAKTANARTPWTSADKSWTVSFRPLLPHESDCTDLDR